MSERRHSDFYAEMRKQEGRTVTFYTKRFADAEVLAEMGGYTATAAHSDFHLSWVIQVPGPGRYMVVKEEEK